MIPRERMQRYQLPNIGDATQILRMLPIENITYRLFRVCFNITVGTGPLQPWVQLFDGGGQMTYANGTGAGNAAGKIVRATFAVNAPRLALGTGAQDMDGNNQFCMAPLPPDLYVTPGDILQFGINGATAPGSGGDDWFSTMVDIVVPA